MPASPTQRTLVLLPTYNEQENLPAILASIHRELEGAHVLVIDDNSPDGTGQLADELAAKEPYIHVMHRPAKLGLGTAYVAGFRYALSGGYTHVFEMDADFSHDPKYLPRMLSRCEQGADVVIGSRYISGGGTRNWGLSRQIISRAGGIYARLILGVGIQDLTSGFLCYKSEVLQAIDIDAIRAQGYAFQIEMKYRAIVRGFRLAELPIVFVDRRVGQSKMSGNIVVEAVTTVWRLRLAQLTRRL